MCSDERYSAIWFSRFSTFLFEVKFQSCHSLTVQNRFMTALSSAYGSLTDFYLYMLPALAAVGWGLFVVFV